MEKVAKNFLYLGTENVATNWRGQTLEEIKFSGICPLYAYILNLEFLLTEFL